MTRRKRKNQSETDNHERWLVSYADFVTLMFAFFVVMYSIASVNETKYREASKSHEKPAVDKQMAESDPIKQEFNPIKLDGSGTTAVDISRETRQIEQISDQLNQVLAGQIADDLVTVKKSQFWLELRMNSELLFLSGSAELSKKSLPILQKVVDILKPLTSQVSVEGHTDNMPIDTLQFPSNWELSASRAASVVREFVGNGIDPMRLSAIGYGEFHPIADNRTEEGRFKNRRVVLLIVPEGFSRHRMLQSSSLPGAQPAINPAPVSVAAGKPDKDPR